MSAASDAVRDPDFVLMSGDFCYHKSDHSNFSAETKQKFDDPAVESLGYMLSEIAHLMRKAFPQPTPILPAMGNNDFTADYTIDLEDERNVLLDKASYAFQDLLPSSSSSNTFNHNIVSTFRQGGYYANNVIKPNQKQLGLTILVLNTVVYSTNHAPDQTYILDPYRQLQWLNQQLSTARATKCKIYIMGHIPPTVGSYRHAQFWHDIYLDQYQELIHDYKDIVVAQLFGHLHSDEFRVLSKSSSSSDDSSDLPPLLLAPALSPKFGNNPSFRMVTFDRSDYTILDYETRFIDIQDNASLHQWQSLPSFRETYGVPDLSLPSLKKVAFQISSVGGVLETFLSRLYVNKIDTECDTECRIEWKCTLKSSSVRELDNCVKGFTAKSGRGDGSRGGSLVILIVSMIFALFFTLFTVRCFYKRSKDKDKDNDNDPVSTGLSEDDHTTSTEQNIIPEIS